MKLLLKKLFLLLNLIALALPLSAADNYDYFVAGTEFEPVDSKDKVFFLKDKSSNSSNLQLKFNEESLFTQDIVVCNNSNGKVSPVDFNLITNDAFNRVSGVQNTSTNITMYDKDYVVTKPTNIYKIAERISEGGQSKSSFGVMHDGTKYSYVNNYMFISNPQSGGAHAHLQYSLYGITANIDYRLEIAYTNISNVTNLGKSSLWLHIYIHGYTGSKYEYIEKVTWQRNAGEDLVQLNDNTGLKKFKPKKDYEHIVITIISDGNDTGPGAILGIDYIRIWAKQNPKPEQPDAPVLVGTYNECQASGTRNFTDYFTLQGGSTTGLKFYNYNTNTAVTTFSASKLGDTQYNYTYTENGVESKKGTITVTVKPNPTITLSSDIKNNAITMCNALNMNLAASASVSGGQISKMEWSLKNATPGVTVGQTTNGSATVSFNNGTGSIFGTADAIFTATAANGCSTSNAANPVKLTNRNCAGLTFTSDVTKQEECEGNEITYTFTLENNLGFASEDVDVSLVLPESGFTVTSTTPSIDGDKWNISKLDNGKSISFIVKGTAQVVDPEAISEDFTLTAYVSRVGESTYNQGNTAAITAQTVVVYNTASTPEFDMDDAKTISQCNNGTFEIVAKTPAIGEGEWTIAPNQDEELIKDVKVELKDPKVRNVALVSGVPLDKSVIIRWTVTNGVCEDETNFVDIELKNDDCTKIDIDSDASLSSDPSKIEVCEGSEVTYTFTLTNKTGVDSEDIIVEFTMPEELTLLEENAITYTAGEYKDGRWIVSKLPFVENPTSDDKPTLTIKGTVSLSDESISSKIVEVTGTIVEVAGQALDPAPTTTSGVTVYNTPSEPELDMERLTSVAKCNSGEFDIKAFAPAIGSGKWIIAPDQDETVIENLEITLPDPNKPNEAKVKGVPLGKTVIVRWIVSNNVCIDADNYAELELTNNNCTTFEPSVDDAEVATCYGTDATFTFTVKNTATVEVKNVKLSLSLESGLAFKEAYVGDIQFDENNQCVIPTMDSNEIVTITVVATATVDKAKATISVIESSGVTVNGVSVSKPVTVYDLPEVSFAAASSTICIDDLDKEKTKVQVNFTKGKPNFKISYTIGEKSFNDILVEENTHSIEEFIDANATISIDKVVDSYGCENTDFGAIKHEVETKKHATLGKLNELADTCEGATLSLTAPTVTENGSTVSNKKWILNEQEFATTTMLDFDAHNGQSIYYQVTSSCNGKEQVIKTDPVTVTVINSNVAFELEVADDKILTAGEKAQVTVVPVEKEAESYQWFANDKELPINGLEFNDYLYLNTEFKVIANGICGTASNKATIEVVWPTAFTPHNKNGKNDDFSKGLPTIVFNRFYTKIFEGEDGWDGTINGAMNESENIAVPGVYYYSVLLPNGQVKKGTIEIIKVD